MKRHKQRKLSNVKMTKDFHFRYMGLWVVATGTLLMGMNMLFFTAVEIHFKNIIEVSNATRAQYLDIRTELMWGLLAETVLFSLGIAALGALTAHRTAGPYLRLRRAFNSVKSGELDHRLKFREYDKLDFLEKAFDEMMQSMVTRMQEGATAAALAARNQPEERSESEPAEAVSS